MTLPNAIEKKKSKRNIATWLFEAGLADYLHIENIYNITKFMLAFPRDESHDMHLLLYGCAKLEQLTTMSRLETLTAPCT